MRIACALLVLLAGCADPDAVATDTWADGFECDYELDDHAGGQALLIVHWDLDGERAMSGIPFRVQLLRDGVIVATQDTATDCAGFDVAEPGPYQIVVNQRELAYCGWGGVAEHDHQADTDTVRIDMQERCG